MHDVGQMVIFGAKFRVEHFGAVVSLWAWSEL